MAGGSGGGSERPGWLRERGPGEGGAGGGAGRASASCRAVSLRLRTTDCVEEVAARERGVRGSGAVPVKVAVPAREGARGGRGWWGALGGLW